jgi:predicted RNase H-like HicB family nuclease
MGAVKRWRRSRLENWPEGRASIIIVGEGLDMNVYDLAIRVEELQEGGDYRFVATSPDLPGLLVAGDTAEEVLSLAPSVAGALIVSLKAEGDPLPSTMRALSSFPLVTHVAVTA